MRIAMMVGLLALIGAHSDLVTVTSAEEVVGEQALIGSGRAPYGEVDFLGRDRSWWRSQIESLEAQRERAIKERTAAENEFSRLYYFGTETIEELNRQLELREQMDGLNSRIASIDRRLTRELPDEARRSGAPPGSLRK